MSKNIIDCITRQNIKTIFNIFNTLNKDDSHKLSNDDICTPMECVKTMLDYIPKHFWQQENIRVLDPLWQWQFWRICDV